DPCFFAVGPRAIVSEVFFLYFFSITIRFFLSLLPEILNQRSTMMCFNKINNHFWKLILTRHFYAIRNVSFDNKGTHARLKLIMFIGIRLIFRKIVWVFHFTNIVIQSANAAKQTVGPNSTGGGLGQVRDLQAVVKGSGCFGHEVFEQG